MKTIKLILLFVALILLATPGTLIFIMVFVGLFKGEFDSAFAALVISLPFLYGAKISKTGSDK